MTTNTKKETFFNINYGDDSDSDEDKMNEDMMDQEDDNIKTKSQVVSQLNENIVEYSKRKTPTRKSNTVTKRKTQKRGVKRSKNNNFFQIF